MNTNKLPNLGSKGWGKSLNDYVEGIETRVSNIEHDLNKIAIEGISWDISSGVVGFNGRMMRVASESDPYPVEYEISDGDEITSYRNHNQFFWKGEVFFKDIGNGTPVYKTIDDDGETYWDIESEPDTGWTPVYLKIEEFGEGLSYLKDSENAYLTHPFVILLGFIFYDGEKIYWHYKTSKSDESTYAKRFMLTRPLAKFNSTFDVKSNGGRSYTITGKQTGNNNPILTLNAMGINYYYTNLTGEFLKKGLDYKEFEISTDVPIISGIGDSSANYADSTFTTPDTLNKRYIHRVFFSNIGKYVLQSEQYDSNKGTDFSTVVGYGFDNIYSNFERYGDLVEIFRFVTEGTEGEGDFINVYQAIGSGIPPVDSFGVVPEVNYVSREGFNNIQFTDNYNNYFTLVGQNYIENATPKVVRFNFNNSDDNYNYHALMNYTDISTTDGIQFKGANTTVYDFTTNNLNLKLSSNRYIKMGILGGFPGIELKNGDSRIILADNGLLNIQAHASKSLWMEHREGEGSGVGLRNDESRIVLADNGDIGLSSQNINLNAASDVNLTATENLNLNAYGYNIHLSASKIVLENPTYSGSDYIAIESGALSSYSFPEGGPLNFNWGIGKDQAEFPSLEVGTLKIGNNSWELVYVNNIILRCRRRHNYYLIWRNEKDGASSPDPYEYQLTNRVDLATYTLPRIRIPSINLTGLWFGSLPVQVGYEWEGNTEYGWLFIIENPDGTSLTWAISSPTLSSINRLPDNAIPEISGFTGWIWRRLI